MIFKVKSFNRFKGDLKMFKNGLLKDLLVHLNKNLDKIVEIENKVLNILQVIHID